MSKVTDPTGRQADAFDLIMRKEFALQIIEGVKRRVRILLLALSPKAARRLG